MPYTLSEHESKELLREAGIAVPPEHLVATADEAVRAAGEVGGPVALKLCGRGIAHKTERKRRGGRRMAMRACSSAQWCPGGASS